jgi:hypothetical protein
MANIQGNRVALEDVFNGRVPQHDSHLSQERLGETRPPVYVRDFAAGSDWALIEGEGFEVLFLAGDVVQQQGGLPAYVRFGEQGPAGPTDADTTGAVPVLAGTCIPAPQGFRKIWFKASADVPWKVVVCRLPHMHIEYGPYAFAPPPTKFLSNDLIDGTVLGHLPYTDPALMTDGLVIPARAKSMTMTLYLVDRTGSVVTRRLASETGPLEVWWIPFNAPPGYVDAFWAHNAKADDWSSAALGDASASHDIERYACEGYGRFAVRDPTGWTAVAADVNIVVIANFYG